MTDIDALLDGLRDPATDPRLAGMDDAVLAGVAERRARGAARRSMAMTGALALGIGVAGSLLSLPSAHGDQRLALGGLPDGAPSTLLMGGR